MNTFLLTSLLLVNMPAMTSPVQASPQAQEAPIIAYNDQTGAVSFIGSKSGAPISVPGINVASLQPVERVEAVLETYGPMFGLKVPGEELVLETRADTGRNQEHYRYQQTYQGIPVLAGEIIVNMTKQGELMSVSGEVSPNLSLSIVPQVRAIEARRQALDLAISRYGISVNRLTISEPELWIYDERLLQTSSKPAELVWRVEVQAADAPVDLLVLVDAVRGGIALQFNQVDTEFVSMSATDQDETMPDPTPTPSPTPTGTVYPANPPGDISPAPQGTLAPAQENQEVSPLPLESASTGVVYYVSTTGDDSSGCVSTDAPCATINGALSKASAGDEIHVASGTYTGAGASVVTISKNIFIYGGWDSGFTSQTGYSTIDGQTGRRGIQIDSGMSAELTDLNVVNGNTIEDGGGIYNLGTLTITNLIIKNNRTASNSGGGGIFNAGVLLIKQTSISGNRAENNGGGIYNTGALTVMNTTFAENYAINGGAMILSPQGNTGTPPTALLNNVTIAGNTSNFGGGIYTATSVLAQYPVLRNTILSGNSASSSYPNCYGNQVSSAANIISVNAGCTISGTYINSDPLLAPYLTQFGVYPLRPTSPAVDTGDATYCESIDQLGTSRPQDGNGDLVAVCDIGAYELGLLSPTYMVIVTGNYQMAMPSSPFSTPLGVLVKNQLSDPVSGVTVTFSAPDEGPSGRFVNSGNNITTALTNDNGIATAAEFTANTDLGFFVLDATVSGIVSPAEFNLEIGATDPSSIEFFSGSPQSTGINEVFHDPLSVLVKDQVGLPLEGASVTFTAPDSGASGIFDESGNNATMVTTNGSGIATSSIFTANDIPGSYSVEATVSGLAATVDFQMENRADLYVSPSGSDANDCQTAATACQTITGGISKADSGDTIRVESGTYTGAGNWVLTIAKNVNILGGWDSAFTVQNGFTTIDGQNARGGVYIQGSSGNVISVSLDHFVLANGGTPRENLFALYANATITNTTIRDGKYKGIRISYSSMTLDKVSIHDNVDYQGQAGGMLLEYYSTATVKNSSIYNNQGSGIKFNDSSGTIQNTTISNNVSSERGGGIYYHAGNSSYHLYLNNVTIVNNRAPVGGGLVGSSGSIRLSNTLIANNYAPISPDCSLTNIDASMGYNVIGIPTGCSFTPTTGDHKGATIFLAPVADYGGPTLSSAILKNSIAVDAGNPDQPGSGNYSCESTDQRGIVRPVNIKGSAICDVGAFEYSGIASTPEYLYPYTIQTFYIRTGGTLGDNLKAVVLDSSGRGVPGITITFTAPSSGASGNFSGSGSRTTDAVTDQNGIAVDWVPPAGGDRMMIELLDDLL
jgi:hypothetical protein